MKMNFHFNLSAESGKITTNDLSAELGKIDCPIDVEIELEASEVQQTIALIRDLAKGIPELLKQKQAGEIELVERRAKLDEHITQVRYQLEADNIRLRADLAGKKEQKPATTKSKKQTEPSAEPNAFEIFDRT